jgi:hypothetical protein
MKTLILDNLNDYVKFQMIPAPLCGFVCSILSIITTFTGVTFGIDLFELMYDPLFIVLVGIMSFIYIITFYHAQLSCKCHVGWYKKLHVGFTLFAGMFAAFLAYLLPQITLFFNTVAAMTDFELFTITASFGPFEIPAMIILPIGFSMYVWLVKGIFISMDNKPRLFFTIRKSDLTHDVEKIYNLFLKLKSTNKHRNLFK